MQKFLNTQSYTILLSLFYIYLFFIYLFFVNKGEMLAQRWSLKPSLPAAPSVQVFYFQSLYFSDMYHYCNYVY